MKMGGKKEKPNAKGNAKEKKKKGFLLLKLYLNIMFYFLVLICYKRLILQIFKTKAYLDYFFTKNWNKLVCFDFLLAGTSLFTWLSWWLVSEAWASCTFLFPLSFLVPTWLLISFSSLFSTCLLFPSFSC